MYKILIDFSWLYNKYYFVAIQKNTKDDLTTLKGMLFSFLIRVPMNYPTSNIYIVLDSSVKSTYNYSLNSNYKQNRNKELKNKVYKDLKEVIKYLKKVLPTNYSFIKAKGYEADQVIASLSYVCSKYDITTIIYSGDKDLLQLTAYNKVYISDKFENGRFILKSDKDIFEKFKNSKGEDFTRISTDKRDILKYRVLKGDPSDNLPPIFPRIKDKEIKYIINNYWTSYDTLNPDSIANMISVIKEDNEELGNKLQENRGTWYINYEIMNLYGIDNIKISVLNE